MNKSSKKLALIASSLLALNSSPLFADCISGYTLEHSDVGVEMCANENDVVQILDLTKGARLEFLYEEVKGGLKPKYIQNIWDDFSSREENAFSVVNGTFFAAHNGNYASHEPAQLAFLLKSNGTVVTEGYESSPLTKTLKISDGHAGIDDDGYYGIYSYIDNYQNALSGLSTDASKSNQAWWVGRNLIGTSNDSRKIYILVSDGMTVTTAKNTLERFGATNIMMLDGSGSAQLKSDVKAVIGDDGGKGRLIPQAIGVISGAPTMLQMSNKVFDFIEDNYRDRFPPRESTNINPYDGVNAYYRYYPSTGSYLYSWTDKDLWYYIKGSGWQHSSSIEIWYNFVTLYNYVKQ